MIEELRDTYQTYLDLSHEERIEILKSSVEVIAQYCMDAEFTQEETFGMLAFIFRLFTVVETSDDRAGIGIECGSRVCQHPQGVPCGGDSPP